MQNIKNYHSAPYVPKIDISLIVLEWTGLESTALRSSLEYFGYRVETHWVGSRIEFEKILNGDIKTHQIWIISNHGDENLGMYTCPEEAPINGEEIGRIAKLNGKSILSLGCFTGAKRLVEGFRNAKAEIYIAPKGAPYGNTALLFAIHVLYEFKQNEVSIGNAALKATKYNDESGMFKIFDFK